MQWHKQRNDIAARAADIRWIWKGPQQFEFDGIVVNPISVQFDAEGARLSVIVGTLSANHSAPAGIDLFHARISALVVAKALEGSLPYSSMALYLRFQGNPDAAVRVALAETALHIANRRKRVRSQGRPGWTRPIPGPILAYVLSTTIRPACDKPGSSDPRDRPILSPMLNPRTQTRIPL